jgi:type VI secretion system protein ImpF
MSTRELERRVAGVIRRSVLDRLTDESKTPSGLRVEGQSEREAHIASVARDLEWLLNTLRTPGIDWESYEELPRSTYGYGLPDLTSVSRDSSNAKNQLLRNVEDVIERFEPRLRDVHVEMQESEGEQFRRELRFVVKGTLLMDPSPQRLQFNGLLDYVNGAYELDEKEKRGGGG